MPDISDLNLTNDEVVGEINWDAPERGTFAPRLEAGKDYNFLFELEEEPWTERQYDNKAIHGIAYKATTTITVDGEDKEVTVRFQKADFFKTPKMVEKRVNSDGEELLRALGIKFSGPFTLDSVKQALREADGRSHFTATVGWNAYFKEEKVNIRTNPRKNDLPWPKGADGKYVQPVTSPKGETSTGREEIVRFRISKGA